MLERWFAVVDVVKDVKSGRGGSGKDSNGVISSSRWTRKEEQCQGIDRKGVW